MNAERLLAHYERIADAPDAIARLRRFVLDLAVRGKLVPQDPNDEPASELLKRIATEKARLVKAGEIRDAEAVPRLNEPPFDFPRTWRWTPLGEICDASSDGTPRPPNRMRHGVPIVDRQVVNEDGVSTDPNVHDLNDALEAGHRDTFERATCFAISLVGSIGRGHRLSTTRWRSRQRTSRVVAFAASTEYIVAATSFGSSLTPF